MNPRVMAVGSFGPLDEFNPSFLIKQLTAIPLLAELAASPRTVGELARLLGEPDGGVQDKLDALARLGIVRDAGGGYQLGFAWFSVADQDAIHAAVAPMASEIASQISSRRTLLDERLSALRAAAWCDVRDLRFAVVGCFGLDWGGLDALCDSGHLVKSKQQPGGRDYVLFIEEPTENYSLKDYVGSHSQEVGSGCTWTSFGDHSGRRYALPDLLWVSESLITQSDRLPVDVRRPLGDLVSETIGASLATALLRAATNCEVPAQECAVLEHSGGLVAGRPAIPVFYMVEDRAVIDVVVSEIKGTALDVVKAHYDELRQRLAGITALRHGVPFAECFNPIWHAAFGQANRLLAEAGYLADPEPHRPDEGRYRWWLTVERP